MSSLCKCSMCFSIGSKYKVCGECKNVYYCSRNCQRSDWIDHRSRCGNTLLKAVVHVVQFDDDIYQTNSLEDKKFFNSINKNIHCTICGCDWFHSLRRTKEGILCEECVQELS
jgi:hypothetical protein